MNIVIYHANCVDGFAAAFAVWKTQSGKCKFFPAQYGEDPPMEHITKDDEVWIVDFSYSNAWLRTLALEAKLVKVIDHHLSFEKQQPWPQIDNLFIYFNKEHSGAWLTWDRYHNIPKFVELVEDYDLWKFQHPDTKPFSLGIRRYSFDFGVWNSLFFLDDLGLKRVVAEGRIILDYYNEQKQRIIDSCTQPIMIEGVEGLVCNAPAMFASDIGNELAQKSGTFGATYFTNSEGEVCFSLRSVGDYSVEGLAKLYGGGGHKNAAGFKLKVPTLTGRDGIVLWHGEEPGS